MKSRYDLAAGVRYGGESDSAPIVTLKGEADLADRVVRLAARFGVPVVEDGALAEAMQSAPLDTEIPEDLFRAIAVVLNQIDARLK